MMRLINSGDLFEAVYLIGVMLFEVRTLMNCNYSYISPVKGNQ